MLYTRMAWMAIKEDIFLGSTVGYTHLISLTNKGIKITLRGLSDTRIIFHVVTQFLKGILLLYGLVKYYNIL